MSDRIAVFNMGVCHQVGTPSEIYNEPANDFVADFIGEINLMPVEVEDAGEERLTVAASTAGTPLKLQVRNTPFHYPSENKGKLALSIRPEAIRILTGKEERPNVFSGKVSKVEFLGSLVHAVVEAGGQPLRVSLLNNIHTNLKAGDEVWVELPEEQIRLIPVVSGDAHV